ncbi:MAG: polysaccharide pyruvyl transferase family protein [Chitinophagaceae bacterium]|nr:polysaccharide pyruvyl transferase family protein [Chitinophagaceae bacterium]MCW5928795.1 polysaccharide pyruvyl transferase family protein [Chitinophagaceae bacterium]
MKKIELKILGAFDRFNYGDLLFPLMIKYGLDKCSPDTFSYKYYSLAGGDYSSAGSIRSMNYRQLVKDVKRSTDAPNNIIVAGGECISASWDVLYGFINPTFHKLLTQKKTLGKLFKKFKYSQRVLGGVSDYPFCIDKNDFKRKIKVLYNSVGGTHIEPPCFPRLDHCDYLAVRENITSKGLSDNNISHEVFPDSAILLSDMFPPDQLNCNTRLRNDIKRLIREKYIFFQISEYYHEGKLDMLAEQLERLHGKTGFSIVLCPIGTAAGHEDHIPLYYLKGKLSENGSFIDTPNVFEIMALIANAKLYIGTSLHGVITSMSYAIPYIGLSLRIDKLKGYLSTWGHKELQRIMDVDKFCEYAETVFSVNHTELTENAYQQKQRYYRSLSKMINILTS